MKFVEQRGDGEWRRLLTPEQYRILRRKGTERPFTGAYWNHHASGTYRCAGCGQELFDSRDKYDSGTGWPSFARPVDAAAVATQEDRSAGMVRTEVVCSLCGGHLGHVFEDGPPPSGRRFCINSAGLAFRPARDGAAETASPSAERSLLFGAGCFWCAQAAFERVSGVLDAVSGYSGGSEANPSYRDVCTGRTGHAEVVRVTYDPARVSLRMLLEVFWAIHDPTSLNRQGADTGTQYRSVVFYEADDQAAEILASREELQGRLPKPIVTEIRRAGPFYPAEEEHQDYFRKHPDAPYCSTVIAPKLDRVNGLLTGGRNSAPGPGR